VFGRFSAPCRLHIVFDAYPLTSDFDLLLLLLFYYYCGSGGGGGCCCHTAHVSKSYLYIWQRHQVITRAEVGLDYSAVAAYTSVSDSCIQGAPKMGPLYIFPNM